MMESKDIFSKRLKQARQKAGLSMEALANAMGNVVTKQTLSKYESGKAMAGSAILLKLCSVLKVDIDYFVRPFSFDISDVNVSFRKKASVGIKETISLKLRIQDEVERFLEIEKLLGTESLGLFDIAPTIISLPMQMIMLARRIREIWSLGNAPITCVKDLLMGRGVKVFEIDGPDGFDGISGFANDTIPIIVINKNMEHVERRRFTQMHELAHLLADSRFDTNLSCHEKEKMCDAFASELILPTNVVEAEFGLKSKISFQELVKLQRTYGISIDAIMYSLKRSGIISDKRHRGFCIKKNCSPDFKAKVEESRYIEPMVGCNYDDTYYQSLVYSALAQNIISDAKAAQLLKCSVSEVESELMAF